MQYFPENVSSQLIISTMLLLKRLVEINVNYLQAWKLYEKSMLMGIVDPKLREHGMEEKDVMQAFQVALLCLQPHADLRPAMAFRVIYTNG